MEIFKTDFKCDFCEKTVDSSKDYVKIVFIKKGIEGKKKYCFCSLLCIEKWLINQDTDSADVNLNNLEEGVINEENKINEKEIIENQKNNTKEEKKEKSKKIKDKSYGFENKYTHNLKYNNEKEDIKKNQENILIETIDPNLKKIKMIDKKDEYLYVEEDTIKKKLKYHFAPKSFFEKMKDRLKIHLMIDYDDEK